jgi:hypothetical protein
MDHGFAEPHIMALCRLRRDPIALERHVDAMVAFDRERGFSRPGTDPD